jgi:hypothetical protein
VQSPEFKPQYHKKLKINQYFKSKEESKRKKKTTLRAPRGITRALLSPHSWVILGELLPLSKPQFSHPHGGLNSAHSWSC